MNTAFSAVDVIRTKRDGGHLSDEQIRWFIDAYTNGAANMTVSTDCNTFAPTASSR